MTADPAALDPAGAAWQEHRARFPDTSTVDLILPDLAGVARGKRLAADAFTAALEGGGLTFPTSLYGMDTTGTNVDASGLIWEEGDADRPCLLDPATLAPVPWRAGGAQILGGLGDHGGGSHFADPRVALRRIAGRFEGLGLTPVCALELEFHLLDRRSVRTGHRRLTRMPEEAGGGRPGQVYALDQLDQRDGFLERLGGYCAAQGIPAKAAVSEYGTAQLEINLGHLADPVRAADHALLLKRAVKVAARAEGLEATFMAKPYARQSGNGLHVHVSLAGRGGGNLFAEDQAALEHAIGGLQATMAEAMLLWAPNANSYRRLQPLSYAPTAPTWGYNNRTVALRVPAGSPGARRIEHRVAGADANPYLVLAAVLAGMHHGLVAQVAASAPTTGNAYESARPGLPLTWHEAIAAFERATVIPDYLGQDLARLYRICRAAERARFAAIVTPTEHSWYLSAV